MSQPTTPTSSSPFVYPHGKGRFRIIVAYWIVILVSLPAWWILTAVQRLPLPASQIQDAGSRPLRMPIRVEINVSDELCDTAALAARIQVEWDKTRSIEQGSVWDALDVNINPSGLYRIGQSAVAYHVNIQQGFETNITVVHGRSLDLYSQTGCDQRLVGNVVSLLHDLLMPPIQTTELRVAQYAPRYRIAFSLLNEDASRGGAITGWDVATAIQDYLQPILNELGCLHNFTIESQVQFYAPLTVDPSAMQTGYALSQEQLTVFVNSAEWTLSSSVSNDPVLHFVLFLPSLQRRPLYIQDARGTTSKVNSFIVPQWGGIAILNPPTQSTANTILTTQDLKPTFHQFGKQLEGLLGIPTLPSTVAFRLDHPRVLTGWQLDALLRRRTLENVRGSVQALTSIVELVGRIENMPVGPSVRSDVWSALDELTKAHNTLQPIRSLAHSAHSLLLASKAFFDPDMVGLLYFPAEHKYAVYTPLFAPIAVPLVVSVLRELKARRETSATRGAAKPKVD